MESSFKYRWKAFFKKKVIYQHPLDLYSKHNPDAEWNPSSFRDFQEYFDEHKDELLSFFLIGPDLIYEIDFSKKGHPRIIETVKGTHWAYDKTNIIHREKRELTDIRPIYYRSMEATIEDGVISTPRVVSYTIGYQGLDKNGNNRKKTVTVL